MDPLKFPSSRVSLGSIQLNPVKEKALPRSIREQYKEHFLLWGVYFVSVSSPYFWVGILRQRYNNTNSSDLPILCEHTLISMTRLPHIALHPTISDLFLIQILTYVMLLKLLRIQAGDKLQQRPVSPKSRHKWFPTHLCTALQHVQNLTNWRN